MLDSAVRALASLLVIVLPFALFWLLRRKLKATWRWIRIGAFTFVGSQVVHIPFNALVLMPLLKSVGLEVDKATGGGLWILGIMLGLSAGICEEVARFLVYKYWISEREYHTAVSLGGGHGGCESMLVGLVGLNALAQFTLLRDKDLSEILPEDQVEKVKKMMEDYWEVSWDGVLLGVAERITAMIYHMSASVLVLQAFVPSSSTKKETAGRPVRIPWLLVAIGFHTWVNCIAVVGMGEKWNLWAVETTLAITVVPTAAWILRNFAENEPAEAPNK